MEMKMAEAAGKKESIRLMIINGPPELDLLFSFARRQFIPLTFLSINPDSPTGSNREMSIYIDGLEWLSIGQSGESTWKIRGHFNADGQTSWVTHPDESMKINLWGDFAGEYNEKTKLGHIETFNWITDQERARQLAKKQEYAEREESVIRGFISSYVKAYVENIKSPDGFVLADTHLGVAVQGILNKAEAMAEQIGLSPDRVDKHSQFARNLLMATLEKHWPKLPSVPEK